MLLSSNRIGDDLKNKKYFYSNYTGMSPVLLQKPLTTNEKNDIANDLLALEDLIEQYTNRLAGAAQTTETGQPDYQALADHLKTARTELVNVQRGLFK